MYQYIPQIVVSFIILLLTPFSKYIIKKIIYKYDYLKPKTEARILQILRIINILINFTSILSLAVIWGVRPQNMLVAFSSIFAVIGVAMFAQWSFLSNITAGLIIFFTTPFKVGDKIKIMDKDMPIEATIDDILTFQTYLSTPQGEQIIIPNSIFLQKIVAVEKEKL